MVCVEITGSNGLIRTHFKYFWAKWVTGFDPNFHCLQCLLGNRDWRIHPQLSAPVSINLESREGEMLYICGVAEPYNWHKNFHLAVRCGAGQAERRTYNGFSVKVAGATEIPFGPNAAVELYPRKGRMFLSCRNFQFGAQEFGYTPRAGVPADKYWKP